MWRNSYSELEKKQHEELKEMKEYLQIKEK